jgi:hypothetical protein
MPRRRARGAAIRDDGRASLARTHLEMTLDGLPHCSSQWKFSIVIRSAPSPILLANKSARAIRRHRQAKPYGTELGQDSTCIRGEVDQLEASSEPGATGRETGFLETGLSLSAMADNGR